MTDKLSTADLAGGASSTRSNRDPNSFVETRDPRLDTHDADARMHDRQAVDDGSRGRTRHRCGRAARAGRDAVAGDRTPAVVDGGSPRDGDLAIPDDRQGPGRWVRHGRVRDVADVPGARLAGQDGDPGIALVVPAAERGARAHARVGRRGVVVRFG